MNYKNLLKLIQKHHYYFLWASEFTMLQAMTKFLLFKQKYPYRHDDGVSDYYNLKILDFTKIKTTVTEYHQARKD